jgi:phosphoribosylamine--glycine ligase
MRVLVLGGNTAADYLSQIFLKEEKVKKVHHFGANVTKYPNGRYDPQPFKVDEYTNFVMSEEGQSVDFVVATTLMVQLKPEILKPFRNRNVPIFSPDYGLCKIEWSKLTGKRLLKHLGIPTANHQQMDRTTLLAGFKDIPRPFVLKYEEDWRNGLQTVIINDENYQQEYDNLVNSNPSKYLNQTIEQFNNQVFVVEDYIKGVREYSWHAVCNAVSWQYLGTARDYKKRYEGDHGHNTAGMGAYSPVEDVHPDINGYCDKIVKFFKKRGTPYVGMLYLGIMIGEDGVPYVLEINTRPGSPEIEAILQTIDESVLDLFYRAAKNEILEPIKTNDQVGLCLRLVNEDYREDVETSATDLIMPKLWPVVDNLKIGMCQNSRLLHSVIVAQDSTREAAADRIYRFLSNKPMGNFTYRKDIGYFK